MKNNITISVALILLTLFYKNYATLINYQSLKSNDGQTCFAEIISRCLGGNIGKIISIKIPSKPDKPIYVYLKDESYYKIPCVEKMYDDLNRFEQNLFDYYELDQNRLVQVIGLDYMSFLISSDPCTPEVLNGGFIVGQHCQTFEWDPYGSVGEIPVAYQEKIKPLLEICENREIKQVHLLIDKRNKKIPVLLGICINLEYGKRNNLLVYVGPIKNEEDLF